MTDRKQEIAANLAEVEQRIAAACAAVGRVRDEVTLIVVTKTFPASDVRILSELGVRHGAENRDQDAAPKAAACADLPLTWHFVGQLQTNKVRSVVGYAQMVQSVDRARLETALSKEAVRSGREVGCLHQCGLVAGAEGLRLDGLMTVAPLTGEYAGRQQAAFERLMYLSTDLRRAHPAANMVSAGMSTDLEQAVAAEATHVRVGSAVLGVRPAL